MSCLSSENIPFVSSHCISGQSCSQYTPLKTVCIKLTTSKVHVSMLINNFVAANKVHYSYLNTHRHWHFFTILITCLDKKIIQVSSILFEIWFIIIDILNTAYLFVCVQYILNKMSDPRCKRKNQRRQKFRYRMNIWNRMIGFIN